MDEIFNNNLKLESNGRNILNAENGLTYCIQVGEESFPGLQSCFAPVKSVTQSVEPTISIESGLETEEDEFLRHEIDADIIKHERDNCKGSENIDKVNGSDGYCFMKKNRRLWRSNQSSCKNSRMDENNSIYFNSKKRYCKFNEVDRNNSKNGMKSDDISSVILNNLSQHRNKNYSDLKVMVNPRTSKCVLKSSYKKSSGTESFVVEPWMNDVPKVLQSSKDRLFIMNKEPSGKAFSKPLPSCLPSSSDSSDISSISLNMENDFPHKQTIQLVKDGKGELRENSKHNESSDSRIIYWEEGNIEQVTDYISLSEAVKSSYAKNKKLENDSLDYFEFSEYLTNIPTYESPSTTKNGAAPGLNVYMSWEAVKERIEEVQEETMTRFVFHYKTPTFKEDPVPFKKIQFELDTKRKDVDVVIPNKGIPFMFCGICVYSCHLGKKRWCKTDYMQEDMNRVVKTKKIGCPAFVNVIRIARFPDFDISDLNPRCENAVLQEVKDAWDFHTSRVRYYFEYHVREPKPSDHKGHEVTYLVNDNRFKEPIDPRILEKVRSLTREGFCKVKVIREMVNEFVKEELFKGEEVPLPGRRRYNPSERDIRYAISKARDELKKEGKNIVQLECSALAKQISESVKNVSQDEYLNQVKCCLSHLLKTIKSQEPLEPIFMMSNLDVNNLPATSSILAKRGPKKMRTEEAINFVPVMEATKDNRLEADQIPDQFTDHAIDQFYVGVPDTSENAFCAQIYAQDFVDMNPGFVDGLHPVPGDGVAEVYYYFPDGTYELANSESLASGQT